MEQKNLEAFPTPWRVGDARFIRHGHETIESVSILDATGTHVVSVNSGNRYKEVDAKALAERIVRAVNNATL